MELKAGTQNCARHPHHLVRRKRLPIDPRCDQVADQIAARLHALMRHPLGDQRQQIGLCLHTFRGALASHRIAIQADVEQPLELPEVSAFHAQQRRHHSARERCRHVPHQIERRGITLRLDQADRLGANALRLTGKRAAREGFVDQRPQPGVPRRIGGTHRTPDLLGAIVDHVARRRREHRRLHHRRNNIGVARQHPASRVFAVVGRIMLPQLAIEWIRVSVHREIERIETKGHVRNRTTWVSHSAARSVAGDTWRLAGRGSPRCSRSVWPSYSVRNSPRR